MAQGENQRLKLLYLLKILSEETDDTHGLSLKEIVARLNSYDVTADRKTMYTDFEQLKKFGVDIVSVQKGRDTLYHIGGREFELPELKLLVDSVQSAKFLTERKSKQLIDMYCAHAYNFFHGLTVHNIKMKRPEKGDYVPSAEQKVQLEAERLAKIDILEQQLYNLQCKCDDFSDISLVGVQVATATYGTGTVIDQEINKITVRFANFEKTFILDERYSARPRFEDDEQIVAVFTEYGRLQEQIKSLQRELAKLQA